jgi:hypothetical protein
LLHWLPRASHAANEASFFASLATQLATQQTKKGQSINRIDLSIPARYEPAVARAA